MTVSYNDSELVDIDETLQLCLRRELHALGEQISNLRAGLRTWLDHLQRVGELQQEFEVKFRKIEESMKVVARFVDHEPLVVVVVDDEEEGQKSVKSLIEECAVSCPPLNLF